jgi:CBS domain-containing protein
MLVREILESRPRSVVTTDVRTTIIAALQLLVNNKISCLPVVSKTGEMEGIVSERDILRLVYDKPADFKDFTVGQIMSTDVITACPEDDVDHIASLMTRHRFRHVPILEGPVIVGLISIGDIVKVRLACVEDENRHLHKFIDGNYPA